MAGVFLEVDPQQDEVTDEYECSKKKEQTDLSRVFVVFPHQTGCIAEGNKGYHQEGEKDEGREDCRH